MSQVYAEGILTYCTSSVPMSQVCAEGVLTYLIRTDEDEPGIQYSIYCRRKLYRGNRGYVGNQAREYKGIICNSTYENILGDFRYLRKTIQKKYFLLLGN